MRAARSRRTGPVRIHPWRWVAVFVLWGTSASAQGAIDGHVSVTLDHLPNAGDATELRARVFAERTFDPAERIRLKVSGWAEGLLADRGGRASDAVALPHEAYVELRAGTIDLRAGLATTVWGRLDEVPPTDVVNPLDVSRYFFEGRGQARLPVLQTRVRWFASESTTVDAIWVPVFRRGRFDALDEDRSPFNLVADANPCAGGTVCIATVGARETPPRTLASSQGGVRVSATSARVDWSVSAYRGLVPFGTIDVRVTPALFPPPITAVETYPRFTMIGADFETARGSWTLRGEAAWRPEDTLTGAARPDAVPPLPVVEEGRSYQLGVGADRRAGLYHLNVSMFVAGRNAQTIDDTNVSLVGGGERTFARETIRVRLFGLWNLADASGFARGIAAWSLRDNLWLEGSIGWFAGEGDDELSRFSTRDFLYVKLKTFF